MPHADTSREARQVVRDVMTPDPACCLPEDPAQRAATIMKERDVGLVPIIDNEQERHVVGVVTDRDLCVAVIAEGYGNGTPVRDCMTSRVVTCRPDDPVDTVADLMEENQIRRIAVTDEARRLEGIVSMADLARRAKLPARVKTETLEKVSEPSSPDVAPKGERA